MRRRVPAGAEGVAARARAHRPGPDAAAPPPAALDALPRRARAGARPHGRRVAVVLRLAQDLAVAACDLRDWEGRAAVCEGRADAADACAGGRRARRAMRRCCDTPVFVCPYQCSQI